MFGRKKKATSVHAFRHLSRHFLHASAFTALPIEPPSATPKTTFTTKRHSTQSTCKRGTEKGPKRPKGLRVYKESALHGPSSVNAASPGRTGEG